MPHPNHKLSRGTVTTIHTQISTSHPGTGISKHVNSRTLEVLGRTKATQQGTAHPGLFDFGLLLQEGVCHGGADVLDIRLAMFCVLSVREYGVNTYACGEGVDADVVLAPFLGDGAAHLVDGGLG